VLFVFDLLVLGFAFSLRHHRLEAVRSSRVVRTSLRAHALGFCALLLLALMELIFLWFNYQYVVLVPVVLLLWAEKATGRLIRYSIAAAGLDVVREDLTSVFTREVKEFRENDQTVLLPALGFEKLPTLVPRGMPVSVRVRAEGRNSVTISRRAEGEPWDGRARAGARRGGRDPRHVRPHRRCPADRRDTRRDVSPACTVVDQQPGDQRGPARHEPLPAGRSHGRFPET
jgi:hypothetical protein